MQRANMHNHATACNRSFDMSLTSAEAQKLEFFLMNNKYFYNYYANLVNPLSSKVRMEFYLGQALSVCVYYDLYKPCVLQFSNLLFCSCSKL